jgi:2',3'-cyclic-nucleotide 2'-phosphodiesterase (5'-nucleotidase family)
LSPPSLITSLRRLVAHLVSALTASSDTHAEIAELKELTVATKAELQDALTGLQTAVTTKIGEATASVEAARTQVATVQTTLDTFIASDAVEDAGYEAQIADLRSQLASASTGLDDAVTSIKALTASVSGAAPEAPIEPSGSAGVN